MTTPRTDRAPAVPRGPGAAGRLARGVPGSQPGRRARRAGHAGRPTVADPRHLRRRDRLGTPARRPGTAAGPARHRQRRPERHPRRRRSRCRPKGRGLRPCQAAPNPGRQLPCHARSLPAARTIFAQTMADRLEWEHVSQHSRHLALAADAELRRRYPDQHIEPLRPAEPALASEADRAELTSAADQKISEMADWIRSLAAQRQAFREKVEERQGLTVPSEDPDWEDLGEAFPAWKQPRGRGDANRSHPSRRSPPRRRSSNSPPSATPNPKPPADPGLASAPGSAVEARPGARQATPPGRSDRYGSYVTQTEQHSPSSSSDCPAGPWARTW
jgi:hypothetical protein